MTNINGYRRLQNDLKSYKYAYKVTLINLISIY